MSRAPRAFAAKTKVPVEVTRSEIDRLLTKNGATQTALGADLEKRLAVVAFTIRGARFRIQIPLSRPREDAQTDRQRWRCVLLLLKAKLELVRMGISTVEREFMADMLLPNGRTVEQQFADLLRMGLLDVEVKQLGPGDSHG